MGVRLIIRHSTVRLLLFNCFHCSMLLPFSLHFSSSSSAFPMYPFMQSFHLGCGHSGFLQPTCFFVSALFVNFSSFILTVSTHFIRLLTVCQLYKPQFHFLLVCLSFFFSPLSRPAIYVFSSRVPAICVAAV